ncbi:hypothetical protein BSYN_24950 [Bacteroides sedimenti]|uniref:Uncharacterized protein n=2 Tax=Bacteroides sedimenti TaxID=2136147 RepID=A0ABM8IE60_9BACE
MTNMQSLKNNIYSFDYNSGAKILHKPAAICMDSVQLVSKSMQKESLIIKEVRSNIGALQGQVVVRSHSEKDSLLLEIKENSKNISAFVYLFSITGTLLQMIQISTSTTILRIPYLSDNKCLMNIQIGQDVFTWKITKE